MNSTTSSFSGMFDGQGHVIHNLNNVASTEYRYGLFGTVHTATICNLGLEAAMVIESEGSTRLEIGTLVSWSSTSVVENCWATGSLYTPGGFLVGGLIGQCTGNSKVIGCSSTVDVTVAGTDGPTVGGLVGQWETTGDESLISDCYVDGTISIASPNSANGCLLGGCFEDKGPTIRNCVVLTSDITHPAFATYLGVFPQDTTIEHCLWPAGAYIQEGGSVENNGPFRFPYGVLLNDQGDVGFGYHQNFPTGDATDNEYGTLGRNVADFSDTALVDELNQHASQGVSWAMGVSGHPVLATQTHLVAADYGKVDGALAAIPSDLTAYTAESVAALTAAQEAVDRTLTADRQDEVNAMADAIVSATANLERLANYEAVDAALEKAEALDRSLYTANSLATLDAATAAVTTGLGESRQSEVDAMAKAIESALAALEKVPEPEPDHKPVQKDNEKDEIPAAGDATVLLAPALGLTGVAVLLARRRIA